MSDAAGSLGINADTQEQSPRLLGIFAAWRLRAYGCAVATLYVALVLYLYYNGLWLVEKTGVPHYTDFTTAWLAGLQALHGEPAPLYDPAQFAKVQETLVGSGHSISIIWPYPPTFLLILAPLAALPYVAAFLTWDLVTLLACITVVCLIVRRSPAIALVLASPFTFLNLTTGQNGFLTALLLGAALVSLERRPVLAGMFIGCLTYKPQLGILIPVALVAAKQWRALASAAATAVLLVVASVAAFGVGVWAAFPTAFAAFSSVALSPEAGTMPIGLWGQFQTVYGVVRYLDGSAAVAWLIQDLTTGVVVVLVWLVWRSRVRYPLKAATLSATALVAAPYVLFYDMAAIAIPVAFLASDQIRYGLLRGEQTIMLVLFVASLAVVPTAGKTPVGAIILITFLCLILRRALRPREELAISEGPVLRVRSGDTVGSLRK